jgi:hypothetical protein
MEFVAGLQHKRATASSRSVQPDLALVNARRVILVEFAVAKQGEGGGFEFAWRLRSTCSAVRSSLSYTRSMII